MKEVKRFKCNFCNKTVAKEKTMIKHEPQCVHNPNSVNCFRCEFAYEGDYQMDEYGTMDNVPICDYTEEFISENLASKCDAYKRSAKMYYERNYDKAEENLKKYHKEEE